MGYFHVHVLFASRADVNFVAVVPPKITMFHWISIGSLQSAQYKSLVIAKFHQVSPTSEIWFGTPGSRL